MALRGARRPSPEQGLLRVFPKLGGIRRNGRNRQRIVAFS
jgi:hypothetical protein